MNVKRIVVLAVLFTTLLIVVSGCGISNRFLAQAEPTSPPTRTPRPTFTPRPVATDTEVPTEVPPTEVPQPTAVPATPTKKAAAAPTKKPTAKPVVVQPTNPPAPTAIPATPLPTVSPYKYAFIPLSCNPADGDTCNVQNGVKCLHSGQHWIDAYVVSDRTNANSGVAGVTVRFSYQQGGNDFYNQTTDGSGKAHFVLTQTGTFYAWVVQSGQPQSPFSPPITLNTKSDSDPTTCWQATVAFAQN